MRSFKKTAAALMLVSFIFATVSPAMAAAKIDNGKDSDGNPSKGVIIYDDFLDTESGGKDKPKASGESSTAMGRGTNASGESSTAMGRGTNASGSYSTAMGIDTNASGVRSTAMGSGTNASGDYSTAMGWDTTASGKYGSTAMGNETTASGSTSTAMGKKTTASGSYSTAMGYGTTSEGAESVAMGYASNAVGKGSFAGGGYYTKSSDCAAGGTAYGKSSFAFGAGAVAGTSGDATAGGQIAVGNNAQATLANTVALGNEATATNANSVALGNNAVTKDAQNITSATIGGKTYTFNSTTGTAEGVVSIGDAGHLKQIVNVANGAITETSTDAVNGGQLYAIAAASFIEDEHNYYSGTTTPVAVTDAVNAVDTALGKTTEGNYIVATDGTAANSVAAQIQAIDTGLGAKIADDGEFIKKSETNTINANIKALDNASIKTLVLGADGVITATRVDGTTTNLTTAAIKDRYVTSGEYNAAEKKITFKYKDQYSGEETDAFEVTGISSEAKYASDDPTEGTKTVSSGYVMKVAGGDTSLTDGTKKKNVTTAITQGTDGNATISVALTPDVELDSVKTGASTLNNTGLTITAGTDNTTLTNTNLTVGGESYITANTGIDSNEHKIVRVADGGNAADTSGDKDAVNYGQVREAFNDVSFDSTTNKLTFTGIDGNTDKYVDIAVGAVPYIAGSQFNNSGTMEGENAWAKAEVGASAYGYSSNANAAKATALGFGAQALAENSVALGAGSIADTANTVSVGTSTAKRQIVNVASAGEITGSNTNATNGADLYNYGKTTTTYNNVADTNTIGQNIDAINTVIGDYSGTVAGTTYATTGTIAGDVKALDDQVKTNTDAIAAITGGEAELATKSLKVDTSGEIAPGDKKVVNGDELYSELRYGANGSYISDSNTTAANLKALDAALKPIDDVIAAQNYNSADIAKAEAAGATAIGWGNIASGERSTAVGYGNKVSGKASGAFGDPNNVSGSGSYAIGNDNTIANANTFVLGSNVTTTQDNSVILGSGSTDRAPEGGAAGVVSVGNETELRQIINLAAGTQDTDAVNVKQMNDAIAAGTGTRGVAYTDNNKNLIKLGDEKTGAPAKISNLAAGEVSPTSTDAVNGAQLFATNQAIGDLAASTNNALGSMQNEINSVSTEVREVGAISAALAGLHFAEPSGEEGDKLVGAVAYGGYRGANAEAIGLAYKPNPNMMLSASTSISNGNDSQNAYNVGFSLKFGKGETAKTRAELQKQVKYLNEEVQTLKNDKAVQSNENAAMRGEIETLKNELEGLKKLIKK